MDDNQKPTNPILRSCQKPAGAEDAVPMESEPKKSYFNIKITDKGKALLLEMTQTLSVEEPACKVAREVKKSPKKVIDPRTAYHEKFGRDAWTKAVDLAGRHRKRAKDVYGLTEHFTAMEWLDLCARFSMVCPWCLENKQLSPHHRKPLHWYGTNKIDNIWPLCWDCHKAVHEFQIGCEGFWAWRGGSSYEKHKHLGFDPKASKVDIIEPYQVNIIPRPERGENYVSYSSDISIFSLRPTCLIENEGHLEWWSDKFQHSR